MKQIIYDIYLKPKILSNYQARLDGKIPDQPYWAACLARQWGFNPFYCGWDGFIEN